MSSPIADALDAAWDAVVSLFTDSEVGDPVQPCPYAKTKAKKAAAKRSTNYGPKRSAKILNQTFPGRGFGKKDLHKKTIILSEKKFIKQYEKGHYKGYYAAENPDGLEGFSVVATKTNYINKSAQTVDTAPHEMLHQVSNEAMGEEMGSNLDEGATEYLTHKAMKEQGVVPTNSYPNQAAVVKKLAKIVGDDTLEDAYFDGDVKSLEEELDEKQGKGTYKKLVAVMKHDPVDYDKANKLLKPPKPAGGKKK